MNVVDIRGPAPRRVVIIAFDGVTASDIAGCADAFHLANDFAPDGRFRPYRVEVASVAGGSIHTSAGLDVATRALAEIDMDAVDTLIVPGGGPPERPPVPAVLVAWLAAQGGRPSRLCSICTGAFPLAEAGLLDGVRITTHWAAAPVLARRFPTLSVESDPVFVRDRKVWSSAGFAGALDLAVALIEEDLDHAVAMHVSQALVMFLRRPGDQPQLSAALSAQAACDPDFARLHAWIMQNLAGDLKIEALADRAGMAPRTFARRYGQKVGRTPARTVELLRIEAAKRALSQSDASLKEVARTCGFGDEQNMRRAFLRTFDMHPERYRSQLHPAIRSRRPSSAMRPTAAAATSLSLAS